MPTKRDYYEILGIGRNATQEDIRKAHRRLVRQYHPDANRDNPQAAEKFSEVQEAYDVLSDADKRNQYNELGHAAFEGNFSTGADPYESFRRSSGPGRSHRSWKASPNVTVEDVDADSGGFSDIFDQFFSGRGRRQRVQPRREKGADIEHSATISFERAARGCTIPMQLNREGSIETIDLKIPSGVREGSRVRLRGKGQPSMSGGNAGDLYITTRVIEHPYYRRDDLDVYMDLPVSIYEAILGAKVDVPTLDGRVSLTVPPGTSSGAKLRIKGRGIRRGSDIGDQLVVIRVMVPRNLEDSQRQLVERLAQQVPVYARGDVRW